jgi:hypothetical protein
VPSAWPTNWNFGESSVPPTSGRSVTTKERERHDGDECRQRDVTPGERLGHETVCQRPQLALLEIGGFQRVDETLIDESRRVALVIELLVGAKLVDRSDRLLVIHGVVARVGG